MTLHINRRIAILGAGPAGMACALWCKRAQLEPVLIDTYPRAGGVSSCTHSINHWMLGQPGRTGSDLSGDWMGHITLENIPVIGNAWVESIRRDTNAGIVLQLSVQHGRPIVLNVAALVIATGERTKGSEAYVDTPGFEAVNDAGRITFGSVDAETLGAEQSGKRIAVIGGGDNAYDTARMLLPYVAHLDLIIRAQPRAQLWMREALQQWVEHGVLTIHTGTQVESFLHAHNKVTLNLLKKDGALFSLDADHIYARLGYTPNSESVVEALSALGELALHPSGHVMIDADTRTSIERVYAAGDVANPTHPCVPTAMALGTIAARTIEKDWFQRV